MCPRYKDWSDAGKKRERYAVLEKVTPGKPAELHRLSHKRARKQYPLLFPLDSSDQDAISSIAQENGIDYRNLRIQMNLAFEQHTDKEYFATRLKGIKSRYETLLKAVGSAGDCGIDLGKYGIPSSI